MELKYVQNMKLLLHNMVEAIFCMHGAWFLEAAQHQFVCIMDLVHNDVTT